MYGMVHENFSRNELRRRQSNAHFDGYVPAHPVPTSIDRMKKGGAALRARDFDQPGSDRAKELSKGREFSSAAELTNVEA